MAELKTTESSISFNLIDEAMQNLYDSKVKYKTNKPNPEKTKKMARNKRQN